MPDKVVKSKLQSTFEFEGVWEDLLENKDFLRVFLSEVLEDYICLLYTSPSPRD